MPKRYSSPGSRPKAKRRPEVVSPPPSAPTAEDIYAPGPSRRVVYYEEAATESQALERLDMDLETRLKEEEERFRKYSEDLLQREEEYERELRRSRDNALRRDLEAEKQRMEERAFQIRRENEARKKAVYQQQQQSRRWGQGEGTSFVVAPGRRTHEDPEIDRAMLGVYIHKKRQSTPSKLPKKPVPYTGRFQNFERIHPSFPANTCTICGYTHGMTCPYNELQVSRSNWSSKFKDWTVKLCPYPPCNRPNQHTLRACPVLIMRCDLCLFRGHVEGSKWCGLPKEVLEHLYLSHIHEHVNTSDPEFQFQLEKVDRSQPSKK